MTPWWKAPPSPGGGGAIRYVILGKNMKRGREREENVKNKERRQKIKEKFTL
jgi:hypothetical protein